MVALVRSRRLDLAENLPEEARLLIKNALDKEPAATRKIYAALAQKVWTLLVERRLDAELRDWHHLLGSVKAYVRPMDEAAAERITALADLLRQSISLAETSPAREIAQRPRARAVLGRLSIEGGFVRRQSLLNSLGLGSSNLSNTLTDLITLGLIERRGAGKQAEYQLTPLGREIMTGHAPKAVAEPPVMKSELIDHATSVLRKLTENLQFAGERDVVEIDHGIDQKGSRHIVRFKAVKMLPNAAPAVATEFHELFGKRSSSHINWNSAPQRPRIAIGDY